MALRTINIGVFDSGANAVAKAIEVLQKETVDNNGKKERVTITGELNIDGRSITLKWDNIKNKKEDHDYITDSFAKVTKLANETFQLGQKVDRTKEGQKETTSIKLIESEEIVRKANMNSVEQKVSTYSLKDKSIIGNEHHKKADDRLEDYDSAFEGIDNVNINRLKEKYGNDSIKLAYKLNKYLTICDVLGKTPNSTPSSSSSGSSTPFSTSEETFSDGTLTPTSEVSLTEVKVVEGEENDQDIEIEHKVEDNTGGNNFETDADRAKAKEDEKKIVEQLARKNAEAALKVKAESSSDESSASGTESSSETSSDTESSSETSSDDSSTSKSSSESSKMSAPSVINQKEVQSKLKQALKEILLQSGTEASEGNDSESSSEESGLDPAASAKENNDNVAAPSDDDTKSATSTENQSDEEENVDKLDGSNNQVEQNQDEVRSLADVTVEQEAEEERLDQEEVATKTAQITEENAAEPATKEAAEQVAKEAEKVAREAQLAAARHGKGEDTSEEEVKKSFEMTETNGTISLNPRSPSSISSSSSSSSNSIKGDDDELKKTGSADLAKVPHHTAKNLLARKATALKEKINKVIKPLIKDIDDYLKRDDLTKDSIKQLEEFRDRCSNLIAQLQDDIIMATKNNLNRFIMDDLEIISFTDKLNEYKTTAQQLIKEIYKKIAKLKKLRTFEMTVNPAQQ